MDAWGCIPCPKFSSETHVEQVFCSLKKKTKQKNPYNYSHTAKRWSPLSIVVLCGTDHRDRELAVLPWMMKLFEITLHTRAKLEERNSYASSKKLKLRRQGEKSRDNQNGTIQPFCLQVTPLVLELIRGAHRSTPRPSCSPRSALCLGS